MHAYTLNPERITLLVVAAFAILLLGHTIGLVMTFGLGHDYVFGLVPMFNIAIEQSVPTVFATLLLLANGCLFLALHRTAEGPQPARRTWLALAVVFCFLGVDESAMIHERLSVPVKEHLPVGDVLFFAWVVPYGIAVILIGGMVFRPIWRLGRRYRLLFAAAACCYVGGAIGVEVIGGNYYQANRQQVDLTYRLYQTVEEILELVGLIVLLYTLLDLLRGRAAELTVRVR